MKMLKLIVAIPLNLLILCYDWVRGNLKRDAEPVSSEEESSWKWP